MWAAGSKNYNCLWRRPPLPDLQKFDGNSFGFISQFGSQGDGDGQVRDSLRALHMLAAHVQAAVVWARARPSGVAHRPGPSCSCYCCSRTIQPASLGPRLARPLNFPYFPGLLSLVRWLTPPSQAPSASYPCQFQYINGLCLDAQDNM